MSAEILLLIGGAIFSALMIGAIYVTNKHIQPKVLFLLFFTEMWERFSFYGMRALLILYMTNELLYKDKEANLMYGAYNALVYTMPLFGGYLADKLLGFRKSILFGGILMAIGHLVLAIPMEKTFFLGLGFLIIGNGFFKPNISSLLGRFYKENDGARDAGYSIFYMGINIGAFLGSGLCGYLGQTINWHLGFGVAGIFMIVGLLNFIAFRHMLENKGEPPAPEKLTEKSPLGIKWEPLIYLGSIVAVILSLVLIKFHDITEKLSIILGIATIVYIIYLSFKEEKIFRERMWAALALTIFSIVFWGFYEQSGGSLNLMAERNVNFVVNDDPTAFTYLNAPLIKGTNTIQVSDATLFPAGSSIALKNINKVEQNLAVDSVLSGGILKLHAPVLNDWAVGSTLQKVTLASSAAINNSLNPFYIIILTFVFAFMWSFLSKRKIEPNSPVKFGIAFILLGIGYYIFVLGGKAGALNGYMPLFHFAFAYLLITVGELFLSPIGLSMISKLSPKHLVGFMMGTWFLASAFGHQLAGWIGSKMSIPETHADGSLFSPAESLPIYMNGCEKIAIVSLIGGVIILILSPFVKKWMHDVH